jgi:hypothetical protein
LNRESDAVCNDLTSHADLSGFVTPKGFVREKYFNLFLTLAQIFGKTLREGDARRGRESFFEFFATAGTRTRLYRGFGMTGQRYQRQMELNEKDKVFIPGSFSLPRSEQSQNKHTGI